MSSLISYTNTSVFKRRQNFFNLLWCFFVEANWNMIIEAEVEDWGKCKMHTFVYGVLFRLSYVSPWLVALPFTQFFNNFLSHFNDKWNDILSSSVMKYVSSRALYGSDVLNATTIFFYYYSLLTMLLYISYACAFDNIRLSNTMKTRFVTNEIYLLP